MENYEEQIRALRAENIRLRRHNGALMEWGKKYQEENIKLRRKIAELGNRLMELDKQTDDQEQ